jgi:hypothetical protein
MRKNGDVIKVMVAWWNGHAEEMSVIKTYRRDEMVFTLWARDEQHAVKICNDRRAQMIANGEW